MANKKIITFLVLTFGLSSIVYYLIASAGGIAEGSGLYVLGLMWSPGVAAILTTFLFRRNLRGLGWGWGKTRYQLVSYSLPLGYAAVVYIPVWLTGLGELTTERLRPAADQLGFGDISTAVQLVIFFLIAATAGVAGSCLSALGEEIGWRGFLVPELAKVTSFRGVALASGLIWSVWHWPLILFADYRSTAPPWYSLICFTIMVMGISVAFAWLRLASGSLWTAMFMHATHNTFIQGYFDPLTGDTGITAWIIGEFGAGLAIVGTLVGLFFWGKRHELPKPGRSGQ